MKTSLDARNGSAGVSDVPELGTSTAAHSYAALCAGLVRDRRLFLSNSAGGVLRCLHVLGRSNHERGAQHAYPARWKAFSHS